MNIKISKTIFITFISLIAIALFDLAILIINIYHHSDKDTAQNADVIIVLGASQWEGKPSPVFQARLDHALDIYNNQYSSKIILTGGVRDGDKISESRTGKNYLITKGIAKDKLESRI